MGVKVRFRSDRNKWYVNVDFKGIRKSHIYDSEAKANKAAGLIEQDIWNDRYDIENAKKDSKQFTKLETYWKRFESEYVNVSVQPTSAKQFRNSFKHILDKLGNKALDKITYPMLREFLVELLKKGLGKHSVRIIHMNLSKLFTMACRDGVTSNNPTKGLSEVYKNAPVMHQEIVPLDRKQIITFLAAAMRKSLDHYALFMIAIHAGLRESEIVGLRWIDLDHETRTIHVRQQYVQGHFRKPKYAKTRKVEMSKSVSEVLRVLYRERQVEFNGNVPELVFCNGSGNPTDISNLIQRHFIPLLAACEIPRRRFHDLRHTFASYHISEGKNPKWIQEQMGHGSLKVTMDIYSHLYPSSDRSAIDSMPAPKLKMKNVLTFKRKKSVKKSEAASAAAAAD